MKNEVIIRVNRLQGKIFYFCTEDTRIEPYFPDMKFNLEWRKCGYEITYDMTGIDRTEREVEDAVSKK